MKISKSKQELARIISENGGWRDGAEWAAQDKRHAGKINKVVFYLGSKPLIDAGDSYWGGNNTHDEFIISDRLIKNWHQTILSREEYFHIYPATDADGWIAWNGGECPVGEGTLIDVKFLDGTVQMACEARGTKSESHKYWTNVWTHPGTDADITAYRLHKPEQASATEKLSDAAVSTAKDALMSDSIEMLVRKPTIEQLAADYRNAKDYAARKQQEADDAKADADAKLKELELAGEALGLIVSPITAKQEPELVITDWRDLQVGDEVEAVAPNGGAVTGGETGFIVKIGEDGFFSNFPSQSQYWYGREHFNMGDVVFIRRP